MESVPDLQKSMYMVVDGFPCVRLVNLWGEIGCSSKTPLSIVKLLHHAHLHAFSAGEYFFRPLFVKVCFSIYCFCFQILDETRL